MKTTARVMSVGLAHFPLDAYRGTIKLKHQAWRAHGQQGCVILPTGGRQNLCCDAGDQMHNEIRLSWHLHLN